MSIVNRHIGLPPLAAPELQCRCSSIEWFRAGFESVQTAERQIRAVLATKDRYTGSGWVLSRRLLQLKESPI